MSYIVSQIYITKETEVHLFLLLPWQHSWLQYLQIYPFATRRVPNTHGSHIVLHVTPPIRLLVVDDPCLRIRIYEF